MSISVPPPEFQFNGLIYNPNFWISPTSTLTQDVANTLYLRKTVTDTASALETFNGGIKTNSITALGALATLSTNAYRNEINYDAALGANDVYIGNGLGGVAFATATPIAFYQGIDSSVVNPITPTTNLQIAPSLTTGELFLGVDNVATGGRTAHIHIGDANNLGAGAGIHINNGTTNASNTNISNGASTSGNVNIMTGATSTGTINLGGSSTVIQVNRPITLSYTPVIDTFPTTLQLGGSKYIYNVNPAQTFSPVPTVGLQTVQISNTYAGIPIGVYFIQATAGIDVTTIGTTTIRSVKLFMYNDTQNRLICTQQNNQSAIPFATGTQNILNVSAVLIATATTQIKLWQEITREGVGGVHTNTTDNFIFSYTRIG